MSYVFLLKHPKIVQYFEIFSMDCFQNFQWQNWEWPYKQKVHLMPILMDLKTEVYINDALPNHCALAIRDLRSPQFSHKL